MKKNNRDWPELNFECQRCLHCCGGEPGYVFLSKNDIERASQHLGVSEEEFISIYCRKIDYGTYYMVSLKEKDNYDCVFLRPFGCAIYEARPHQCSTYPFWRGLGDDKDAWEEEKKNCPGLGKGRKYSKKEAQELIDSNDLNPAYIIFKHKL